MTEKKRVKVISGSLVEITGRITGDGECWCMSVTEEEYKRIVGEEEYERELKLHNEMNEDAIKHGLSVQEFKFRIYPNDLMRVLDITKENKLMRKGPFLDRMT